MIYEELKHGRVQRGLTLAELSRMTGIAQPNLSRLERGRVDARLSTLVTVAGALGFEVTLVPEKALSLDEVRRRMADGRRRVCSRGLVDRRTQRRLGWKRSRGVDTSVEERLLE